MVMPRCLAVRMISRVVKAVAIGASCYYYSLARLGLLGFALGIQRDYYTYNGVQIGRRVTPEAPRCYSVRSEAFSIL